ncbi:MAG: hypothetical protein IT444_05415 [Phycisphaeraceae bacterium]|nr:hypothetical protein [Phycisphaeraceae bacterium]
MPSSFPDDASLCESCGYPLRGLTVEQVCPECGMPVADSDFARRPGLAWQKQASLSSFFFTIFQVIFQPRKSFRSLRVGGSNAHDRVFLLLVAIGIGLVWGIIWKWATKRTPVPWEYGTGVTLTILLLSYIETLGVTYIARRRRWRVPWRLAERAICYASPAWVIAAAFYLRFHLWHYPYGRLWNYLPDHWGRFHHYYLIRDLWIYPLVGGVAVVFFETFVWIGMRQLKFANFAISDEKSGPPILNPALPVSASRPLSPD